MNEKKELMDQYLLLEQKAGQTLKKEDYEKFNEVAREVSEKGITIGNFWNYLEKHEKRFISLGILDEEF